MDSIKVTIFMMDGSTESWNCPGWNTESERFFIVGGVKFPQAVYNLDVVHHWECSESTLAIVGEGGVPIFGKVD